MKFPESIKFRILPLPFILILGLFSGGFAANEAAKVQLSILENEEYELTGGFKIQAPLPIVWSVLTDYEGIDKFISFVQTSKIKDRIDGTILLEQESAGHFWFFSKTIHVLLKIREDHLKSIHFEDLAHRDFQLYQGSWTLEPLGDDQINVRYELKAIKSFFAPGFIARTVFRDNVQSYLSEVEKEIRRRSEIEEKSTKNEGG